MVLLDVNSDWSSLSTPISNPIQLLETASSKDQTSSLNNTIAKNYWLETGKIYQDDEKVKIFGICLFLPCIPVHNSEILWFLKHTLLGRLGVFKTFLFFKLTTYIEKDSSYIVVRIWKFPYKSKNSKYL